MSDIWMAKEGIHILKSLWFDIKYLEYELNHKEKYIPSKDKELMRFMTKEEQDLFVTL